MSKVLVVEDDPLLRFVIGEVLRDSEFDVVEARSADEALQYLKEKDEIDLIFTDINMPGKLNGLDLAKAVQSEFPEIKVFVTSGRPQASSDLEGLEFVPKPYIVYDLVKVLKAALNVN